MLPRLQWPELKTASVRAVMNLVMTALLVWAIRPSPMVSGLLIILAVQGAWTALVGGKRYL